MSEKNPLGQRVVGYPRSVVEPLLWLSLLTGAVWLLVALDASTAPAGADLPTDIGRHSLALGAALCLNAAAALWLMPMGNPSGRFLAALAGIGLGVSGWEFHRIPEIDPDVKEFLTYGGIGAGALLLAIAVVTWRSLPASTQPKSGSVPSRVVLALLNAVAVLLAAVVYDLYGRGLVGVESGVESAWDNLIPVVALMAGVLGATGSVWRRHWGAGLLVLAAGAGMAEAALYAVR